MLPTSGDSQTALERIRLYPAHLPPFLSPGEAVELVLVPVGVEEETHAAGEVGGGVAGGVVEAGPAGDSSREHGVGDHCDLEDDENDDS